MEVAELFAKLGFRVDQGSWNRANTAIQNIGRALATVASKTQAWGRSLSGQAAKLAAGFGFTKLITAGLKFNSTVEEARNQIAGMLALTKKTDLADQLGAADALMASLQKRAAKLPGTTAEYVQMLSAITQPITDAGLGLQDLEDITVRSTVAAKALAVPWDAAARDIDQALRGQFRSTDAFSGKVLGSIGYKGEEGRSRFNALGSKGRASELKRGLGQKQWDQLAAAQGQTASGKLSTLQDTAQQVLGKITAPLFAKLVGYLEKLNVWLEKNSDKVKAFGEAVGDGLVKVLGYVVEAIQFLADHPEVAVGLAAVLAVLLLIASPVALIAVGIVALIILIKRLGPVFEAIGRGIKRVAGWIRDQFEMIGDGVIAVGKAIAAPYIAAAELVKSVFNTLKAAVETIVNWCQEKFEWIENKAKSVKEFLVGEDGGESTRDQMLARVRGAPGVSAPTAPGATGSGYMASIRAPAAGGPSNVMNTSNITVTVNAANADAQGVAGLVKQQLQQAWSDAHGDFRGGKR